MSSPGRPSGRPYKPQKLKATYHSNYDRQKYLANRTELLASLRKNRNRRPRTVRFTALTDEEKIMVAQESAKMESIVECVDASKILVAMRDAAPGLVEPDECDNLCMQVRNVTLVDEVCNCSEWCRAVGGKGKDN
jgi:hypothetical protein